MTIVAVIGTALAIVYFLLKNLLPKWLKKRREEDATERDAAMAKDLYEGNDIGASNRLSDELDRVHRGQGNRNPPV